jgi:hypothetical protein
MSRKGTEVLSSELDRGECGQIHSQSLLSGERAPNSRGACNLVDPTAAERGAEDEYPPTSNNRNTISGQ